MTVITLETDGVRIHAIRVIGTPDKLTHGTGRPPPLANGNDRTDAEKTQAIAWRQGSAIRRLELPGRQLHRNEGVPGFVPQVRSCGDEPVL